MAKDCFIIRQEGVIDNDNLLDVDSLYIEAVDGAFNEYTELNLPIGATYEALSGNVTFTQVWVDKVLKKIRITSTGPAKVKIKDYVGLNYIRLAPWETKMRILNPSGVGIIKAYDVTMSDYFWLNRCEIGGDISMMGNQPALKEVVVNQAKVRGNIVSLGTNVAMTRLNLSGCTNLYGDEDALFNALASNGKTITMGFDFRNTGVISSSGKVLNGVVTFSGGSWSIQ